MGLVKYQNSWVTIIEAENYLADKVDAIIWTTNPSLNSNYLIEAFWLIYSSKMFSIAKTNTSEKVKNAQCEMAFWLKENWKDYNKRKALQDMGVKEFNIDTFRENYKDNSFGIFPNIVTGLLTDYIASADGYVTQTRDIDY